MQQKAFTHNIIQLDDKAHKLFSEMEDNLKNNAKNIINNSLTLSTIKQLINDDKYLNYIIDIGNNLQIKFKKFVILGTGGSTLNGQALCGVQSFQDQVIFIDNIDPHTINLLFDKINFKETAFVAISKSGSTLEVWAQTLTLLTKLEELSINPKDHLFFITDFINNNLFKLAKQLNCTIYEHEQNIGGRYAGLTIVGLLPALLCGLDINEIRNGAKYILNHYDDAITGAAFQVSLMQKHYPNNVLIPYIDRLFNFTIWFRQMWSESLGKDGKGSNPVVAQGTLDQHSQLQLYLDGPNDKIFTLILNDYKNQGYHLNEKYIPQEYQYLNNKNLGDVIVAEQEAMLETLKDYGCNLRIIRVQQINEYLIGSLMMHYTLETIFSAYLIDINPYDQPAVEYGKRKTKEFLSNLK